MTEPRNRLRPTRSRFRLALLLAAVVLTGVASRTALRGVPVVNKELGDVLWAAMFYLIVLMAFPRLRPAAAAGAALAISVGTELSQLYKAPWIESLRAKPVLGMLLGNVFAWHDVGCYVVGTAFAFGTDLVVRRRATW
ncbi:MAG TPA: DUF2809 domain-containing protein [Humisphaera sp.]